MIAKSKLALKLSALVLLAMMSAFSLFIYSSVNNIRQNMMDSYLDEAQAIAYALDLGIGSKEALKDDNIVLSQIQKMMWLQEDILSITINLPEGGKLVHYMSSNYMLQKKAADEMNLEVYRSGTLLSTFSKDKGGGSTMLKVISPIHLSGKIAGTVEMAFTLENIERVVQSTIRQYIITAVFLSITVLLLSFLLIWWLVLVPVRELNKGVKAISGGNSTYKVKLKSNDEFSALAGSFNQMADDIVLSKNLLKKHQDELELQVTRRTKELQSKINELEKLNNMTIGRELRMVELKKRIEELEKQRRAKGKK
jgi:HAMP domain-containing protein